MEASQIYIAVSIVVLAILAVLAFLTGRGGSQNRLTPLAGLAFSCVAAGIVFGDERLLGYSLMGIGVVLAIVDAARRSGTRR